MALHINDLKKIDAKQALQTLLGVMKDFKVLAAFLSFFLILYFIGVDTVYMPMKKELDGREETLQSRRKEVEELRKKADQNEALRKELGGLTKTLIMVAQGDSAKVVSLKESGHVVNIAKGLERVFGEENPLPPPHDKRDQVNIVAKGISSVDILQQEGQQDTSSKGSEENENIPGGGGNGPKNDITSLPLEKHDYEIQMVGTYPALVEFINQLTSMEKLVVIDELTMTPVPLEDRPNPADEPNFPLMVQLKLQFSLYLYNAT